MANVIDQAQERDALNLQQSLHVQRIRAAHAARLKPTGQCLDPTCEDTLPNPLQLFCNPECERRHARIHSQQ